MARFSRDGGGPNRARSGLHARLRRENPDYVPPPHVPPAEARRETLVLFLAFVACVAAGAAGIWLGIL